MPIFKMSIYRNKTLKLKPKKYPHTKQGKQEFYHLKYLPVLFFYKGI